MTTVYLIRHGESEGNLFRVCQGQDDELLSATGIAQTKALGQRFKNIPLAAIYASDLYRAAMTALAVARPKRMRVQPDVRLREIALGICEGESWGSVYRMFPELHTKPLHEIPVPGAETTAQVMERMTACMNEFAARNEGMSVVAVSHGGAISSFLDAVMPDVKLKIAGNTAVITLGYQQGKWSLIAQPDLSHLEKAGLTAQPLFREGITDLWFKPIDPVADADVIERIGRESWMSVFGSLAEYRADIFIANARRLAGRDGLASLCMDGEQIAGMLLLDADQTEHGIGHISLVYLEPAYRYHGVGMQLIGRATTVYRRMGRNILRLQVAQKNKPAIRFYQKCGFRFSPLPCSLTGQLIMKKNITVPKII